MTEPERINDRISSIRLSHAQIDRYVREGVERDTGLKVSQVLARDWYMRTRVEFEAIVRTHAIWCGPETGAK
jgi:hypothetical protein